VVIKLLLLIKKHFAFLWRMIELLNGILFRFTYYNRIKENAGIVLEKFKDEPYRYQLLKPADLELLFLFIQNQDQKQFEFFKPHAFDKKTLIRLQKNPSFLMFGVFDGNSLIGYFFLRCFLNKRCFIGRMVDVSLQGQGLGKIMGKILYQVAWNSGFRIFSTISINNVASFNSHKANQNLKIVNELSNNYYLVEFINSQK
jgi:hypothetical protein